MAVVVQPRAGARFQGDDGESRTIVQISRGLWPTETELWLMVTRNLAVGGDDGAESGVEEVYVTPGGLRLWARPLADPDVP